MHGNRRRKKRPNYGLRTVEVSRGPNGFGFTISGQQPCILSCIVSNSPADQAGLRAGDFLISVNSVSVSKMAHDAVVSLIGNCVGPIRMTIAENYYSDSSDEDLDYRLVNSRKPKPRIRTYKHETRQNYNNSNNKQSSNSETNSPIKKAMKCEDINLNVNLPMDELEEVGGPIEYKAIVGYLGTIEMPKQLLPSNRLQTVCSCIRKLRQEKRSPTTILMTILPTCLTLKNASNHILAIYPTNRVVYISSTNDKESRYFGLVTSAFCDNRRNTTNDGENANHQQQQQGQALNLDDNVEDTNGEIEISNSCHVFVTDSKIIDHSLHARKAENFRIICTPDIVTGNCLEFPRNALYIVSLVQNMYKLQDSTGNENKQGQGQRQGLDDHLVANSPQPSASSNSDSGIGFRDDCGNISDRILVVEFPTHRPLPPVISSSSNLNPPRPSGIDTLNIPLDSFEAHLDSSNNYSSHINNLSKDLSTSNLNNIRACDNVNLNLNKNAIEKSERNIHCEDYLASSVLIPNRLGVRAMPGGKLVSSTSVSTSISTKHVYSQNNWEEEGTMRIADVDTGYIFTERAVDVDVCPSPDSMDNDNISMHSSKSFELSVFKTPSSSNHLISNKYFGKKNSSSSSSSKKAVVLKMSSCDNLALDKYETSMLNYKLSPKVYGVTKPNYSCEELSTMMENDGKCSYRSLQDLSLWTGKENDCFIAQSEPDVRLHRLQDSDSITDLMAEENAAPPKGHEGPQAWSSAFEKLLEDPIGLHTFAEFLKKEFSAENIYFWTACERYRCLPCGNERQAEAQRIYKQHLCLGAPEPVNVDSQARQCTEQRLQDPDVSIFDQAQKQIFNLMKFDSYPRFLKSDLYKTCLEGNGNVNGHQQLDAGLLLQPPSLASPPNKLKKSLSNAEDRRRKSLLPWHRKNRSKSKDRGESEYNLRKDNNTNNNHLVSQSQCSGNNSDLHSSKSSLTSLEAMMKDPIQDSNSRTALCKVILNKEVTSIVQIKPTDTIKQLVNRMLEKRGLSYSAYEVFIDKQCKGLDNSESALKLAGLDVTVEQRVTFKLDLPNQKIIAVKSKCSKVLVDVLKPILAKYNFSLEEVNVCNRNGESVNINLPVTSVDGGRLHISLKNDQGPPKPAPRTSLEKQDITSLDEITNKVYEDILQEKSDSALSLKPKSTNSVKSEDWGSEHSSGIFSRFLRRDSGMHDRKKKTALGIGIGNGGGGMRSKDQGSSIHSSIEDVAGDASSLMKKPIKAKWKPGVKLQIACSENDELYEGLTRASRSRLEDQRGTEINFELPDFLKDKENNDQLRNNARKARRSAEAPSESRFFTTESVLPKPERVTPPISSAKNLRLELQSTSNYENRTIMSNNNNNNNSSNSNRNSPSFVIGNRPIKQINNENGAPQNNVGKLDPPPLPPKPKVQPIKPSNWGQNIRNGHQTLYLEHPTSSFV